MLETVGVVSVQRERLGVLVGESLADVRTRTKVPGAAEMLLPSVAVQFWARVRGRVRRRRRRVESEEMGCEMYMVGGSWKWVAGGRWGSEVEECGFGGLLWDEGRF